MINSSLETILLSDVYGSRTATTNGQETAECPGIYVIIGDDTATIGLEIISGDGVMIDGDSERVRMAIVKQGDVVKLSGSGKRLAVFLKLRS